MKKIICLCTVALITSSLFSCYNENSDTDSSISDTPVSSLTDSAKSDSDIQVPSLTEPDITIPEVEDTSSYKITEYYDRLPLKGTEHFSKIYSIEYSSDKFYLLGEKSEKNDGNNLLNIYNNDGEIEKEICFSSTDQISSMKVTSDGTVFLLVNKSESEYIDSSETTQSEILRLKEDGTFESVYISQKRYEKKSYLFSADNKGNICICEYTPFINNEICATYINSAGQQTDITSGQAGIPDNIICKNDTFNIIYHPYQINENYLNILTVDNDSLTMNDPICTNIYYTSLIEGRNGCDLYFPSNNTVFGCNINDNSAEKIFSWLDCDVTSVPYNGRSVNNSRSVIIADPENIFYVENGFCTDSIEKENETVSVIHLKKADQARLTELNNRTIITLSGINVSPDDIRRINEFNRNNSDYMIMATDYSQYNSLQINECFENVEYSKGFSRLKTDIASSNTADVILGNPSFNFCSFLSKDLLYDLNDLLRNDPEIDNSDLAENILEACKYNGKQYTIPLAFGLETLAVQKDCINNQTPFTYDDFFSIPEQFSDKSFFYTTPSGFLYSIIPSYLSDNIDFNKSTCNFQTDNFKKILEKSKEKIFINTGGNVLPDSIFRSINLIYSYDLYREMTSYGSDYLSYCFKGIPSSSDIVSQMQLFEYMSITNSCENKEGAWEFIKYCMYFNNQSDEPPLNQDMLSVFNSKNKEFITDAVSQYTNASDNTPDKSQTDKIIADLNYLLDGKIINYFIYLDIYHIIIEESEKYYNDTQSIDETISAIQSKADLYLSEN